MTLAQGLVRYESLLLSRDDEVGMMFEMFKTCKHLGISVIEIYASLVDAPYDETQVEPSYTQPTPLSYPLFETQTSHHSIPSSSTNHPSESTHNIDLNSPYRLNISNDVAPISVVAGVHNEEVGDFSEHEDDIAAQHVDNDDEDQEIFFSEPPSHFRSVTSGDMEYVDNEFIHSMSRNQSYLVPDPDNLQEGMRFPTKELAIQCIREYHLNKAPDFVVTHSDSKRWIVQCANESCMWRKTWIAKQKAIERIYGTITDIEAFPYIKDGQVDPRKELHENFQECRYEKNCNKYGLLHDSTEHRILQEPNQGLV
ncbi:hypothetical protein P8452_36741 [Trifolium repens]|nr:hypothetical protein P8452_36741 [Trifolium repens]